MSFVGKRKTGKQWVWHSYDKETKQILAFHIGKRSNSACKKLLKKLEHLQIDKICTDNWKSYKSYIAPEKHIISKARTTHIERRNRDFRTHIKRLARKTVCNSKSEKMHYGFIKAYIFKRNSA